jgi:hypothetical protein
MKDDIIQEKMWKIRDYIKELENIKKKIIEFSNSEKNLDNKFTIGFG